MRLEGKIVVGPSDTDCSIDIGLSLIRANENARIWLNSIILEPRAPPVLYQNWINLLSVLMPPGTSKQTEEWKEFWTNVKHILKKCEILVWLFGLLLETDRGQKSQDRPNAHLFERRLDPTLRLGPWGAIKA
ncbi:hypothetical protein EVAR_44292_1 [Eumeta japonica]|uniref:Uncharacterized protein n=1 Tax=Eumeta variegata TaxID=151549 RepID=A0A4C1WPS6_EUMVA|nr:hypothetical protein EVAR_44292_1 [Eumeta japonica]